MSLLFLLLSFFCLVKGRVVVFDVRIVHIFVISILLQLAKWQQQLFVICLMIDKHLYSAEKHICIPNNGTENSGSYIHSFRLLQAFIVCYSPPSHSAFSSWSVVYRFVCSLLDDFSKHEKKKNKSKLFGKNCKHVCIYPYICMRLIHRSGHCCIHVQNA